MKNKLVIFVILIMLAGICLVSDSSASTTDIPPSDEVASNTSEAKKSSSANATITITWTTASPPGEVIEDK